MPLSTRDDEPLKDELLGASAALAARTHRVDYPAFKEERNRPATEPDWSAMLDGPDWSTMTRAQLAELISKPDGPSAGPSAGPSQPATRTGRRSARRRRPS